MHSIGNPPSSTVAASNASSSSTKRKQPVRRDPEKRRLQNIQAQKKYREKMRRRLGDLEALAVKLVEGTPAAAAAAAPAAEENMMQPKPSEAVLKEYEVACKAAATSAPDPFARWDPSTVIDPSHLIARTTSKKSMVPHLDLLESGYSRQFGQQQSSRDFTSYVNCGCAVQHVQVRYPRSDHDLDALRFLDMGEAIRNAALMARRPAQDNLFANHLLLEQECVVAAMWSNCLQIGISEASFCGDDAQSPFYRDAATKGSSSTSAVPSTPLGGDMFLDWSTNGAAVASDSVVHTVQSIFRTLKPDLRPIKEQVSIPHHPFLDILPFPTFRRNVLRSEILLDEDEICHDIIHGLICWGGRGISKKDRNNANATGTAQGTSSGTPWDSRSWEAKPWFLRKYWDLLGGEDGELVRQSEWWREVREEDIAIDIAMENDEEKEDLWLLKSKQLMALPDLEPNRNDHRLGVTGVSFL